MLSSILATKLHIPAARPKTVLRPRLTERLNAGLHCRLTLIAAPAGFGKSTLVSEWLAGIGRPTAWLSLDAGESDPTRFLTYLVASLQTIDATMGEQVLGALQAPQPPPPEAILTALLNEISAMPGKLVLVLDDYHAIDAKLVDTALTFLIERMPPQMHLVITTREDPRLPLARLRARGQLAELRAADLRFTAEEAAEFLSHVMGLHLSAADIAALEERTEGWVAGLQLAALSMQGHQDATGFIRAFAGDHRYIVDYLVEEVLQRQPELTRRFLLQTAILDRLSGPLCDAVTGQEGGGAQLEALVRGNFFVVPLDDRRHWYRYHHLFADVLAAHLRAEHPDQIATLHRRASVWYERNGALADAIHHALDAADFERAADMIEQMVPALRSTRQEAAVLGWLTALPDDLIPYRPVLSVHYAWALLSSGRLDGVEGRLRDAERWITPSSGIDERVGARSTLPIARPVVVDQEAFRRLPGSVAVFRAGQALALGDLATAVANARRALDLAPEDDHLMRGAAASMLGITSWANGDLEAAHQGYAEGMARLQRAGNIADTVGCAIALADIRIAQGRLHDAMRIYEQALQLAAAQGTPMLRGTAGLYVGMSELQCEQNNLHAARQHLRTSQALGEHMGLPQHRYRWRVAMARIRTTEGDLGGALELLEDAERLYVPDFMPNVRPVAALKTRVWLAQGRLAESLGWAREQGLSAQDDLSYLREFAHMTLARVLLAHARSDRAKQPIGEVIELLDRLLRAAEAGGRAGSAIEILLLQALAQQASGDIPAALAPLARALALAEPEGYVRMVVDEGPPMAQLLREALAHGIMTGYVELLLAASPDQDRHTAGRDQAVVVPSPHPLTPALAEPLSERELDVLRLLRTDLSGPEIARELIVSLSTVRTHTRSIFAKLGVGNRRAAIRRAEELGLF